MYTYVLIIYMYIHRMIALDAELYFCLNVCCCVVCVI